MAWSVAAVPLLILLLTWLSLRAINTDAELFDRVLAEMDRQTTLQAGLHRDVLSARAGLLRNYDPLVAEVNALRASLTWLRGAAPVDATAAMVIDRLTASFDREEALVEQFKSENALLRNSLAYFELFASQLSATDQAEAMVKAVGAAAAAILRLTLDTSAATAHEADERLAELARAPVTEGETQAVAALLAHGQLLRDLVPATDGILRALSATPRYQDWQALRAAVLRHQGASRATARLFRVTLYVASLLLLGVLVHLAIRLRARARALQRRAAFEHVIAGISMRFLAARPQDLDANIRRALAELAACVGADRAYVLLTGPSARQYTWCAPGLDFPPGWPERAPALAARLNRCASEFLLIPDVARLPAGAAQDQCVALGLRGWVCTARARGEGACAVLGFDLLHRRCHMARPGELGLMRMALDTILNAITREALESDRSHLEMRLEQARRMETVGALASGIAHNFNNILAAILGYAELADEQAGTQATPRYLTEIRRAAERARVLVEQILTFGRRSDARHRPVSIRDLVTEAASLLAAALPRDIELVVTQAPQAVAVLGEHAQLLQVVLNLCNNAAQAMDNAGRVEIATEVLTVAAARSLSHGDLEPGDYVCVAVSDAGRGIDGATLARIFEPFFTTRSAGNGLGLATVREIVREHGGALDVTSRPGIGSRFAAWLPCTPITGPSAAAVSPVLARGDGESILLIEAERGWRLRHEEMLAALGYEPAGFATADAALSACREAPERFDMAMVGRLASPAAALELAAALLRLAPHLRILLAKASADAIDVDALLAAGISDVVHWPLDAGEISAAIADMESAVG
jgi:signal transduction histidine kinase